MQPFVADTQFSVVCVFVYWVHGWAVQNGYTDRDAIWGLTRVGPRNQVSGGGQNRTNPFAAV